METKPVLILRSILFWIGFIINTGVFGLLILILFFTPSCFRLKIARLWSYGNNFLLKIFCGLKFRIEGQENLNNVETAIILSKHQSTWETLALHSFTPLVRWVFKRELMRIPVFGWALALTDPIAIDRGAGRAAIKQLITEGTKKLNDGKWMVLFPEGTRTAPGKTHKYKIGGALLAAKSGYPVIPIAHNAGEFWPKHSFIKWPGTIRVVIGPAIETKGRSADEINTEVFNWIEDTMKEISDPSRWKRTTGQK
ncbi:MAG: lysophospholipid acyltransferase family protein [Gammaproteobacteria bacterium]